MSQVWCVQWEDEDRQGWNGMERADRDKSTDSCPGDKAVDSASTAGRGRRDIVCWLVEAIRVLNGG